MKKHLYSVFDRKALSYAAPFTAETDAVAIRMFGQAVNDPSTMFSQHPDDFELYHCGDQNVDTGVIDAVESPRFVVSALGLIKASLEPEAS